MNKEKLKKANDLYREIGYIKSLIRDVKSVGLCKLDLSYLDLSGVPKEGIDKLKNSFKKASTKIEEEFIKYLEAENKKNTSKFDSL